jgi:hypothetical protein
MRLEGDEVGGGSLPKWVKPQLCKLVDEPPDGSEWLHEIKYDGYRMHARLDRGKAQLLTRTGLDWTHKYAPIAGDLSLLPAKEAYLDGELCGIRPDGKTSFNLIQAASDTGNAGALVFFLFDLVYLDGEIISSAPLLERKEHLRGLLSNAGSSLQYSDHQIGRGPECRGLWVVNPDTSATRMDQSAVRGVIRQQECPEPRSMCLRLGPAASVYRSSSAACNAELERLWRRLQLLATSEMPLEAKEVTPRAATSLVARRVLRYTVGSSFAAPAIFGWFSLSLPASTHGTLKLGEPLILYGLHFSSRNPG